MTSTTLADIQAAIVSVLDQKLPSLKTCSAHEGRFDANEIKRVAGHCPAMYVACLGMGKPAGSGSVYAPVRWGIFVVTKDTPAADRNTQMLALVQAANVILAEQTWGLDETRTDPERVASQNLFGSSTAGLGVSMWAITWTQEIQLDAGLDWNALNDFLTAAGESTTTDGATINTEQSLPGASA